MLEFILRHYDNMSDGWSQIKLLHVLSTDRYSSELISFDHGVLDAFLLYPAVSFTGGSIINYVS